MPRRSILTERQRSTLFDLPTDEATLLHHYTLADDDIEHIRTRRQARNRLGFALQLCAFRYPGRLLLPWEIIPLEVSRFLAAQLCERSEDLACYAETDVTRRRHLIDLRRIYGFKVFSGRRARDLKAWLEREVETARSNEDLARRFVEECRRTQTILPGVSVIERLCADALVAAERRIESRIAARADDQMKERLDAMLTEMVDGKVSRFVWLRQFEVGNNSAGASRLLDRLEFLQALAVPPGILEDVPPHRVTRLRRQGERYFADGLRDITSDRRLAILAVCAIEWTATIADAVIETHDRIVGKTWRDAKKLCDARIADARSSLQETLRLDTSRKYGGNRCRADRHDGRRRSGACRSRISPVPALCATHAACARCPERPCGCAFGESRQNPRRRSDRCAPPVLVPAPHVKMASPHQCPGAR
jgi:hypothetical protein